MFVGRPYVCGNSFSIRNVANHSDSHIIGLKRSLNAYAKREKNSHFFTTFKFHVIITFYEFAFFTTIKHIKIPAVLWLFIFSKSRLQSMPCNFNWMHWGLKLGWGRPSIQANRSAYCFCGTCLPRLITPKSVLAKHAWIPEITILIQR